MRRKDREVTDPKEIRRILENCKTCHVAMIDDGSPYVVPLSYGFEFENDSLTLYFHCAKEGRKLDILRKNPVVCFNLFIQSELYEFAEPCNAGYYYKSITGTGNVAFVNDIAKKAGALTLLMRHHSGQEFLFSEHQTNSVCVFKIVCTEFTAKSKGTPQAVKEFL